MIHFLKNKLLNIFLHKLVFIFISTLFAERRRQQFLAGRRPVHLVGVALLERLVGQAERRLHQGKTAQIHRGVRFLHAGRPFQIGKKTFNQVYDPFSLTRSQEMQTFTFAFINSFRIIFLKKIQFVSF